MNKRLIFTVAIVTAYIIDLCIILYMKIKQIC